MPKAKKVKTERRTIVGKVKTISEEREHNGQKVVNLDIEIPSPETRVFVDVALWDQEGIALLQGKRLNDDATAWVKFQPPITVGARLSVTGSYRMKDWKPTKSKAMPKTVKKGYIPVYDSAQLRVITLPKL